MNIVSLFPRMLQCAATLSSLHLRGPRPPKLMDEPRYNEAALDFGAEEGRPRSDATDQKGYASLDMCTKQLQRVFPDAQVTCKLSFPMGWTSTVPMKATIAHPNAPPQKVFIKLCDDDADTLDSVEKEYAFQHALQLAAPGVAPDAVYYNRQERLLVSSLAPGTMSDKHLFSSARMRQQLAASAASLHQLDGDTLPGEPCLFFRSVPKDAKENFEKGLLSQATFESITHYAKQLEQAIALRYDPSAQQTVVHGDLKANNIMFDASNHRLTLLDFGMAHKGDPASDLGYFLADVHRPISDAETLTEAYQAAQRPEDVDASLPARVALHTAYNRLGRYVGAQQWGKDDPARKSAMAFFVLQDFAYVADFLRIKGA